MSSSYSTNNLQLAFPSLPKGFSERTRSSNAEHLDGNGESTSTEAKPINTTYRN